MRSWGPIAPVLTSRTSWGGGDRAPPAGSHHRSPQQPGQGGGPNRRRQPVPTAAGQCATPVAIVFRGGDHDDLRAVGAWYQRWNWLGVLLTPLGLAPRCCDPCWAWPGIGHGQPDPRHPPRRRSQRFGVRSCDRCEDYLVSRWPANRGGCATSERPADGRSSTSGAAAPDRSRRGDGWDARRGQGPTHSRPVTASVSTRTRRWTTSRPSSLTTRCSASPPRTRGKATHVRDHTSLEPSAGRDEGERRWRQRRRLPARADRSLSLGVVLAFL